MEEAAAQESNPVNGASDSHSAAEPTSHTATKPEAETSALAEVSTPTNGPDEKNKLDTAADSSSATADSKKRKHSPVPEDDRDWRIRRAQDNSQDGNRRFGDGRDFNQRGGRGRGRGRGRGSGEWVDYRSNVKTNYERPESRDPDEIRKQVEFYFSDSNLPTDKFLLEKTGGSANKPVPIGVIHSFKRMRHFQPYSAVVEALRASELLEVNDSEEVTRKEPLPDDLYADPEKNVPLFEDKTRSRSIYAKGFGEEGPNTQFDIEAFFAPYGPTNAIRLRRYYPEKTFKGSVFVEFDSDETAKQFLALENKPKWEGRDLKIMSKEEYVLSKAKDFEQGKNAGSTWRGHGGGRGRGSGRGSRGGGGRDRGDKRGGRRDGRDREREDRRRRDRRGSEEMDRSKPEAADPTAEAPADESGEESVETPKKAVTEETPAEGSKKRARDDDDGGDEDDANGAGEEHGAKKVRSR